MKNFPEKSCRVALGMIVLLGWGSALAHPSSVRLDVDETKGDQVDHYEALDQRALVGLDRAVATKALAGDGQIANEIAHVFARANRVSESRYWLRISAENGSGVGMYGYANALSEYDCRRAIYWFKKAQKSEELHESSKEIIDRTVNALALECN